MSTPVMTHSLRNLGSRVTVAVLLYLAITAVLLTGTLGSQLDSLADRQLNELGNAMSAQLSETLKQHIISKNMISAQVTLDNLLADTPVVARSTLYSSSNRILAQSQREAPIKGSLIPYTQPITVDDNMLAQVRIELDKDMLLSEYRSPMWLGTGIWLLLSAALGGYLAMTAQDYSRRILRLSACFGKAEDPGEAELDQLESALAPFVAGNGDGDQDESAPRAYGMLAISIPNLPKWRAQLNAEHFTGMLAKVDTLIDNHLSLYKGARIHTRDNSMLLQFMDLGDQHPMIRTINCANSLLQLTGSLIAAQKIPFEMRITAAYRHPGIQGSTWYSDIEREECIHRLLDILPLAGGWELIIDKKELTEADLPECELEDLSAALVWQFRTFTGQRQDEFIQRLEFLGSTLG